MSSRTTHEPGATEAGPMKLTGQQVARAGELFVAAEIHRRGGYAVTFAGNMPGIDMLASDLENTRRISVQVKTKGPCSPGWQTSTLRGLSSEPNGARPSLTGHFWVLVDLVPVYPEFYVMQEEWIRREIDRRHKEYLDLHGGHRPRNPKSTHHRIDVKHVAQWHDAWHVLGILPAPTGMVRPG